MWSIIEGLYDLVYFVLKNAEDIRLQPIIFYVFYLIGKRRGMHVFKNYLEKHFPVLKSEESEWKIWVTKQIAALGGSAFVPKKEYGRMKKSKGRGVKNSATLSTLLPEGSDQEGNNMQKTLIATDDGHGMNTNGKRTPLFSDGTFMRENEFNRAVVDKLNAHLIRNNFEVLHVSAGDNDVPLKTRTDLANNTIPNGFGRKADVLVSVHANALGNAWNSKAKGIEIFYYAGSKEGKRLAQAVQEQMIKGTPLFNRGLKTNNLHITRESLMPSILIEGAFMDNPEEAVLLKSDAYREECAEEIAKGLCKYFGVEYLPTVSTPTPENNPPITKPLPTGLSTLSVVANAQVYTGYLQFGTSWIPAKPILNYLNNMWTFQDKRIILEGVPLETTIIDNQSYIKAKDLLIVGARIFFDNDAAPKRLDIFPKLEE